MTPNAAKFYLHRGATDDVSPWTATWPQGTGTSLLITAADFSTGSIHPPDNIGICQCLNPVAVGTEAGNFVLNSDGTGRWPKVVQMGYATVTPSASSTVTTQRVNFPYAFATIPMVTVSAITLRPDIVFATASAIDASGFDIPSGVVMELDGRR